MQFVFILFSSISVLCKSQCVCSTSYFLKLLREDYKYHLQHTKLWTV